MILGQTIRAVTGNGSDTSVYFGPWMSRAGTKAVFACNHIASSQINSFTITIETKKAEDDNTSGSIVVVGNPTPSSITLTADSVTAFPRGNTIDGSDASSSGSYGLRDLFRYRYTIKSNSGQKGWVHFRMLEPSWETD